MALADTQVNARGWTHQTFGRLVFDRAARLATSAEIKGHKLVIVFNEPVSVRLIGALDNLKSYVEGPLSAQGRTLELTLTRPATLNQFVDEGNLVLDLRPADAWPDDSAIAKQSVALETGAGTEDGQAPKTEPPKTEPPKVEVPVAEVPKAEPPKTKPPEAEAPKPQEPRIIRPGPGNQYLVPVPNVTESPARIVVRHGNHGTFTRLAIDWPGPIAYRVARQGDRIEVVFTASADIDVGPARRDLPKELAQIAATNKDAARIYLTLAPGARLRDFRLGHTVVLDIMRPAQQAGPAPDLQLPGQEEPATTRLASAEQTGASQAGKQPESSPQQANAASTLPAAPEPEPAKPMPQTIAESPVAEPPAPEPKSEPAAQVALQSLPAMPEPAPAQPPAPVLPPQTEPAQPAGETAQPTPPPMPEVEQAALPPRAPVDVQIKIVPAEKGIKVILVWPQAVPAAAFHRNGALWLAFDMPSNDIGTLLGDAQIARLGKASKIDVPDATIVRIAEASPVGVALAASGKSWIVDLTPGGRDVPTRTIEQRRENLADGASSLLLRTNGPGRVVNVSDPSGGNLYVVPVRIAGLGIAERAEWPEFQLLPSHQGVVIASAGDAITVDSLSQGVVITTKPQGALTPVAEVPGKSEQIASKEQEAPPEQESATATSPAQPKEGEPILANVPGLFDLPSWRRGGEATFTADQRQLEAAVSSASDEDKAAARLALGEFYFAHGLIAEADSTLSEIGEEGGDQIDRRELALLTGAIQTLDGQFDKAHASLSDKSLAGVAETNLFSGMLAAREEKWVEAAKHFSDPLPNIGDYPKPVREDIYLTAGTALNNAGNPIAAQRFADALRQDQPEHDARDRLAYLDGHIKLTAGDRGQALALWASLADSDLPEIKARSQFDLVEEKLKGGDITPADAIAPLEALRFVNRGGDFEFNLLRKLGTLYLDQNQPRKGLVTLRDAAANFPNRSEAKDIGEQMSAAFRGLYLDNGADRLPPLTAVALYDEFRELTPPGADGDRMMSLLADRLVKVDLLSRAGELLETLVQKRLSSLDKSQAGTRLAAIRMLDQKPDLALKALKESEMDEPLPPELAAERQRLGARATFDSGDSLGGLRMLEGDDSLEAKWLRADMLWRLREWPAAATALGDVVTGEEQAMADERAALKEAMDPVKHPAASVGSAEAEAALEAKQEQHFKERVAPLLLNEAVALSLASDRRGLKALANDYGKRMEGTDQEKAFAMLTAPDNGLVESVSAELSSVDRIDAFVTDYRERLKKQSLSEQGS